MKDQSWPMAANDIDEPRWGAMLLARSLVPFRNPPDPLSRDSLDRLGERAYVGKLILEDDWTYSAERFWKLCGRIYDRICATLAESDQSDWLDPDALRDPAALREPAAIMAYHGGDAVAGRGDQPPHIKFLLIPPAQTGGLWAQRALQTKGGWTLEAVLTSELVKLGGLRSEVDFVDVPGYGTRVLSDYSWVTIERHDSALPLHKSIEAMLAPELRSGDGEGVVDSTRCLVMPYFRHIELLSEHTDTIAAAYEAD